MYYLYDLPLPFGGQIYPRPNVDDGGVKEMDDFELMDVATVMQNLLQENFKASSALAIIDFLIRHGFITEESDRRYVDVCRLLKGNIIQPVPWCGI